MKRAWGVTVGGYALLCSGCFSTTVSVNEQRLLLREQRTIIGEDQRLTPSVWHFHEDAVVGRMQPTMCDTTRVWETNRERVTVKKPNRAWAIAFLSAGALSATAGSVLLNQPPERVCNGQYPYESCTTHQPGKELGLGFASMGLALGAAGLVALLIPTDVRVEPLAHEQQLTRQLERCLSRHDLGELLLVLRGPGGQLWPIQVGPDGAVSIPMPGTPPIPRGTDLQLVVYRAPHSKAPVVQTGAVLDTLQLPEE
ncbi:MAG TPA: hypothetical protein VHB79_21595 [Polyangiaceae bacterium]|nr:hypothetical protein [Polyangiaceae bacterium]